ARPRSLRRAGYRQRRGARPAPARAQRSSLRKRLRMRLREDSCGSRRTLTRASVRPPRSCASLVCIREEQLLAADLVTGDRLLSFWRDEPIDERLPEVLLDVRVLCRVDEHHAVLIEQPLVTLDEDLEVAAVLEREPCAAIGEDVRVHRRGGVERRSHSLADV